MLPHPKQLRVFSFSADAKGRIAEALGLDELAPCLVEAIEFAVSGYFANKRGSRGTTRDAVRLALARLVKKGRHFDDALHLFASDRSGVDSETHLLLRDLAQRTLEGDAEAESMLLDAARLREIQLASCKRWQPEIEILRHFVSALRAVFDGVTVASEASEAAYWPRCRRFVREVMDSAGIETADFVAHPERLTEYLRTELTFLEGERPEWAHKLYLRWRDNRAS
jgi:hypothetical protein